MKQSISVTLIEDNPEYQYAIELSLKNDPVITLIQRFGTAELALRELEPRNNAPLAPDLILLDLNLPGMSGHDTIPWLRKYTPHAKIVVLTQSDKDTDILKALQLGASGYLLKSALIENIRAAILNVMEGGGALDPKVIPTVLNTIDSETVLETEVISLSPREQEVLTLLADGLQKKEIASELSIGTETVNTHIKNLYIKLEASNAPAAINKAYQTGLLKAK